jgi:hypothetical protein
LYVKHGRSTCAGASTVARGEVTCLRTAARPRPPAAPSR